MVTPSYWKRPSSPSPRPSVRCLLYCLPNYQIGKFIYIYIYISSFFIYISLSSLFLLQVENNPRTGNFGALVRVFLGRTKELKISTECQEWVWEPRARQRGRASYCLMVFTCAVVVCFSWENCWGLTVSTCCTILHSPPSSTPTDMDPARVPRRLHSSSIAVRGCSHRSPDALAHFPNRSHTFIP